MIKYVCNKVGSAECYCPKSCPHARPHRLKTNWGATTWPCDTTAPARTFCGPDHTPAVMCYCIPVKKGE